MIKSLIGINRLFKQQPKSMIGLAGQANISDRFLFHLTQNKNYFDEYKQ